MDLNELFVFTKVVQTGSFIRAARELRMPKSTVSRKVSALEERLGARLLQRTTRKLSLTDVGHTYYGYAARVVAAAEEAELAVTHLQHAPRGPLRVTMPLNFAYLGPAISSFLKRYPDVQLELVCADRVIDLVAEGYDVAVRVGHLADSTLVARPLGTLERFLVASPAFLEQQGTPKRPPDLERFECIVFGAEPARATFNLSRGEKSVKINITPRFVVNDFDLLEEAVYSGLGIAMLPSFRCSTALATSKLKRVLPQWSSPRVPIQAVYASTRHLSPKVKVFVDHLRQHMAALSP